VEVAAARVAPRGALMARSGRLKILSGTASLRLATFRTARLGDACRTVNNTLAFRPAKTFTPSGPTLRFAMILHRATVLAIPGSVQDLSPDNVTGITNPLLAVVLADDGRKVTVVLKPTAPLRRSSGDVAGEVLNLREVVCSLLLRRLGFDAPEPFVITGGALSWEELAPDYADRLVTAPHFATELLKNARECAPHERLSRHASSLQQSAEDLYTADNVIVNCDRSAAKPNLWWRSDALIPIDHGLAFHVLLADPDTLGIPHILQRNHAVFDFFERSRPTFKQSFDNWLPLLTSDTLDAVEAALPAEWVDDHAQLSVIRQHLLSHHARAVEFQTAITRSLSP